MPGLLQSAAPSAASKGAARSTGGKPAKIIKKKVTKTPATKPAKKAKNSKKSLIYRPYHHRGYMFCNNGMENGMELFVFSIPLVRTL